MTVGIIDLVGKDIAGRFANVIRPEHRHLFAEYPAGMVKKLIRAEIRKTRKDGEWLYLLYEKHGARDCGYSGWRLDYHLEHGMPTLEFVEIA